MPFVSPAAEHAVVPPTASIQNLTERAQRTRDPQEQLALHAAIVSYALRDASRAVDACIDFLSESKVVRDDMRARGVPPENKIDILRCLREDLTDRKAGFEVLAYGRAETPTKFVRDEIESVRVSEQMKQEPLREEISREEYHRIRQAEAASGLPAAAAMAPSPLLQEIPFKEAAELRYEGQD